MRATRHISLQKVAASRKKMGISVNDFSACLSMRRCKKLCS